MPKQIYLLFLVYNLSKELNRCKKNRILFYIFTLKSQRSNKTKQKTRTKTNKNKDKLDLIYIYA